MTVLLVSVVALVWPTVSYVRALTFPGEATVVVRTVEWVRDHGGGGIVDLVEDCFYAKTPSSAPPDPTSLPVIVAATASNVPAAIPAISGVPALPEEGVWAAGRPAPGGRPAAFTTFERPDPRHLSVVAGVAWFDRSSTAVRLVPGTTQPNRSTRLQDATVPAELRPALVATFNSGFKMKDAHGGYYVAGRTVVPLRDDAASVVIRADGTATVARWGRDAQAGPDVVAVRQNLDLIVDDGRAVAGLDVNTGSHWGTSDNQLQYTWRSGLGVDASGNLIYVGGDELNLVTLAAALTRAGAVRGMELDIHSKMVELSTYGSSDLVGTKLLPTMPGDGSRFLVPDQRDSFAVTLR